MLLWLGPLKGFTPTNPRKPSDRLVRSDEEFRRIQRYIELNPVTAGFVQKPERRLERRLAGRNAHPTHRPKDVEIGRRRERA
jgi:hypothetical protein